MVGVPAISVTGGLSGSLAGMKSCTRPRTVTRLPTAAVAEGVLLVKTKIPSEVLGSASASESGNWMKKPFVLRAVTTPSTCTTVFAKGEKMPAPWTSWMASLGTAAVTVKVMEAVALRLCASLVVTGIVFVPVLMFDATVAVKEKVPLPLSPNVWLVVPPIDERSPVTAMPLLLGCPPGETVTVRVVLSPAETPEGAADAAAMLSGVGAAQSLIGEEEFRGLGAAATKSAELLSVSTQPSFARIAAVVLLSAGAAAISKKLAPS